MNEHNVTYSAYDYHCKQYSEYRKSFFPAVCRLCSLDSTTAVLYLDQSCMSEWCHSRRGKTASSLQVLLGNKHESSQLKPSAYSIQMMYGLINHAHTSCKGVAFNLCHFYLPRPGICGSASDDR